MNEETKGLLKTMHEMGNNAEKCISLLQTAFIYNSVNPLKECCAMVEAVKKAEPELTKRVTNLAKDDADLTPYVPIPVHLLRIAENIERLCSAIEKKIKDGILFSDRAVTETTFILQRLTDILRPTSDIILTKNTFLNRYVQESEAGIVRKATEFATSHEERLVKGLCLSVASSIYINMLDAAKSIAWHAKEIAAKIVGWMLPKA